MNCASSNALFDLADALLSDTTAGSFVELSQASSFRRTWSSLYAALDRGRIDRHALQHVFFDLLPRRFVGERLVLGLDTSSVLRKEAHTSLDRTLVDQANLPPGSVLVAPGWSFSTLVVLPDPVSSWTYVLNNRRVTNSESATSTGVTQLQEALPRLVRRWGRPVLLLARRYANAPWIEASSKLTTDQIARARADQVLYRPAPPHSGKRGRPCKDGARFKGSDPSTHGPADERWSGHDAAGRPVEITVWQGLHLRKAREVELSVICISRHTASDSKRDPRVAWFWYLGEQRPTAQKLAGLYGRRFGQEHGYGLDKQELLWDKPVCARQSRWIAGRISWPVCEPSWC